MIYGIYTEKGELIGWRGKCDYCGRDIPDPSPEDYGCKGRNWTEGDSFSCCEFDTLATWELVGRWTPESALENEETRLAASELVRSIERLRAKILFRRSGDYKGEKDDG